MNSWSRDGGFYKCPVVKSLLVLTGASSLFHYILSLRTLYPSALLCLRVWALPTPGTWLMAAMILYYCRVLERREGSQRFFSKLFLSGVCGVGISGLLVASSNLGWGQLAGSRGGLIHTLIGVLLVQYLRIAVPTHTSNLAGIRLSGNVPFYLLSVLFSCSSVSTVLLTFSGMAGGLLINSTGLLLPSPPKWAESVLVRILGRDNPPNVYSGASLQVQRQQRMDDVERMVQQMQQRQVARHVRIGNPVQAQPVEPPEEQVAQLVGMGFSRDESVRALLHTGCDIQAAVQLLTTARQH